MPFEGAAFTTTWTLELPEAANPVGLHRVTDVRITFDIQAAYEVPAGGAAVKPQPTSRSMFVSALAVDATGLATLRNATKPQASVHFDLDRLAMPPGAVITNLAVVLPAWWVGQLRRSCASAAARPSRSR